MMDMLKRKMITMTRRQMDMLKRKKMDHDDHDGHDDHEGHAHGEYDPHIWLDPINAKVILKEMTEHLIENDSKNRSTYKR